MSFISNIDKETQRDLIKFINDSRNNKEPRPLKSFLVESLLEDIVKGRREITGFASDWENGDVFVRLSFTDENREEYIKNRKKAKAKRTTKNGQERND